jgi:hypothetical protein
MAGDAFSSVSSAGLGSLAQEAVREIVARRST